MKPACFAGRFARLPAIHAGCQHLVQSEGLGQISVVAQELCGAQQLSDCKFCMRAPPPGIV
jgi:hypothetical protein